MSTLEQLLGIYTSSLLKEGERYARISALSLSLQLLKGCRSVVAVFFVAVLGIILFTASFLSLAVYWSNQYSMTGEIQFNAFVAIAGSVAMASSALLIWALREKRWLDAYGVQRFLRQIEASEPRPAAQPTVAPALDEKRLGELIERLIDQKLGGAAPSHRVSDVA